MGLSAEQRGVLAGMLLGAVLSAAAILAGAWLIAVPGSLSAGDRADWLLPFAAVLALPLAASVAVIARHRFFHAAAIGGANDSGDRQLTVARAVLQNTLEQTVLAALVFAALAALLPASWLGALPAAALWFVVARLAFGLTYAGGAAARSFGFAATFYPSLAGLASALVLLVLR